MALADAAPTSSDAGGALFDCLGFLVPEAERQSFEAARREDAECEAEREAATAELLAAPGARGATAASVAEALTRSMLVGLSQEARPRVWAWALRAEARQHESELDYCGLVERGRLEEFASAREQIEKDLLRTFPGHPSFREPQRCQGFSVLPPLRRMLSAFCARCGQGYCQGLSFMAGILLLVHQVADAGCSDFAGTSGEGERVWEALAFWTFVCLVEDVMLGFHGCALDGVRTEVATVDEETLESVPMLHAHLGSLEMPVASVVMEWLLTAFTTVLPSATLLHILDLLVLGGRDVLVHTAVTLIADEEVELLSSASASVCRLCTRGRLGRRHDRRELASGVLRRFFGGGEGGSAEKWRRAVEVRSRLQARRLRHGQLVLEENRRLQCLAQLQQLFTEHDLDCDGKLDRHDFAALVLKTFGSLKRRSIHCAEDCALFTTLFDMLDSNGDGTVSKQEFLDLCRDHPRFSAGLFVTSAAERGTTPNSRLRHLFDRFDVDKNGGLDEEELAQMLSTIYSAITPPPISRRCTSSRALRLPRSSACSAASAASPGSPMRAVKSQPAPTWAAADDEVILPPRRTSAWLQSRSCLVEAAAIFREADKDGDGIVSFEEFVAAATSMPVMVLGAGLLCAAAEEMGGQVAQRASHRGYSAAISGISRLRQHCGRAYTAYLVQVTLLAAGARDAEDRTEVARRYRDFLRLHAILEALPGVAAPLLLPSLPNLPPRRPWQSRNAVNLVAERRETLQHYLDAVRGVPDAAVQAALRGWLGIGDVEGDEVSAK